MHQRILKVCFLNTIQRRPPVAHDDRLGDDAGDVDSDRGDDE